MLKKIKAWMWWRGITFKDVFVSVFCLGFLITTAVVLIVAAC